MAKPVLNKFHKHLEIFYYKYKRYIPNAYDETLTLLEKVDKLIDDMNDLGMLVNDVVEKWKEIMEWVMNDGLSEAVKDRLDELVEDGTLEKLINERILQDIQNNVNERMINVCHPPAPLVGAKGDGWKRTGWTDDTEALRNILKYAYETNQSVLFPRMCAITGELEIKKTMVFCGVGSGAGYADLAITDYEPISGIVVKGNIAKRRRTRRLYRASASDPQDAPLSVALNIQAENVVVRDLTVFLDLDRGDLSPRNYGHDCDIGIFIGCRVHTTISNVNVMGYFDEASIYQDVTRGTDLPQWIALDGLPYDRGSVPNGSDGLNMYKVYTKGGRWGLKIQGAQPKVGEKGYSTPYYDEILGGTVTDRRGNFGASDVTAVACSFYGTDHHTKWRRDNESGNYLSDRAGGAVSLDGLAGNASGVIQGMRLLSCRISTWEPFRLRMDRVNRVELFGCHIEWGSNAFSTSGQPVTEANQYGVFTTTENTQNVDLVAINSRIRWQYVFDPLQVSNILSSSSEQSKFNKGLLVDGESTINGIMRMYARIMFGEGKEADISSGEGMPIRLRMGAMTRFLISLDHTDIYNILRPNVDNTHSLGTLSRRFTTAYLSVGLHIPDSNIPTDNYIIRVRNGVLVTEKQ